MIKLTDILNEILAEKKLCPKGRAYYDRRIAAGEKPSAYLSGRAVKVCKGLMEEDEKNKKEDIVAGIKKSFKGDKSSIYAIATAKAKKLAEGDELGAGYTHFALFKNGNKIATGWDYSDLYDKDDKAFDNDSIKEYAREDIMNDFPDNSVNDFKLVTRKFLEKQGINPTDISNWFKSETSLNEAKVKLKEDNQTITCEECGWDWLLSDGGKDPYLCHKCGNDNTDEYDVENEQDIKEFVQFMKEYQQQLSESDCNCLLEAKYQGRTVPLGKPMRGDSKKFKVYVKNPKTGKVIKVNFGAKGMNIKKNNPVRRKAFRARHNCDNPGPRTKARYWSCRKW
jgi:Zn finger protein HypA/HybF involved in hydrogenase expression